MNYDKIIKKHLIKSIARLEDDIFDSKYSTATNVNAESFTEEKYLEMLNLLKDLEEKYPKKDRIEAILVTYNDNLISPETILKSEYENKNYIMMNIFNFNKILEESKYEEKASFDVLYQGIFSFSGIPVWYDDELIIKILKYNLDKIIEKYKEESGLKLIESVYLGKYFWSSPNGIC